MSTVRGHLGIYTMRHARKRYRCDGDHGSYYAKDVIDPGEVYFRAALPPGGELGYEGWKTMRLCWTCAPIELTRNVIASARDTVPF